MKARFLIGTLMLLGSAQVLAASADTAVITTVYAGQTDNSIAIKLDKGYPVANANNECAGNNGYAGIAGPSDTVASTVLAAKAMKAEVIVVTEGCYGSWLKIKAIYIK